MQRNTLDVTVLDLALLGGVGLTWCETHVQDLEGERLRAPTWGEGERKQIPCRVFAERRGRDVGDVKGLVIAVVNHNGYPSTPANPWRVENAAAGESATQRPVIVGEKACFLQADNICLLEQRLLRARLSGVFAY